MTPEQRKEIYDIAVAHYKEAGLVPESEISQEKVDLLGNGLLPIYQKLEAKKLIPEGMTVDAFFHVVIPRLEMEVNNHQVRKMFGMA